MAERIREIKGPKEKKQQPNPPKHEVLIQKHIRTYTQIKHAYFTTP